MRIMAIDYGKKRTGLAVTDPLQIIAHPLDTIQTEKICEYFDNYLKQEKVEKIIIGHPKHSDNTDADIFPEIKKFSEELSKKYPEIEIIFWDERFTSKMAVSEMIKGGYSKKDRRKKENIDKIAAYIMLQEYMQII